MTMGDSKPSIQDEFEYHIFEAWRIITAGTGIRPAQWFHFREGVIAEIREVLIRGPRADDQAEADSMAAEPDGDGDDGPE